MTETAGDPEISVVMSVYNDRRHLHAAIESVLTQAEVDLELIVVDDGSTDDSAAILEDLAKRDPRVRVVSQANAGLTRALMRGCSLARGEYIARQDADDESLPGRLLRQVQLLRADAGLAFVSCWSEVMGPEGEPLIVHRRPADPQAATHLLVHGRSGPPGHGSVMMRRSAYEAVGGYRAIFRYAQDSDLWLRLATVGRLAYVPEVLYRYRVSAESISGRLHTRKLPYARLIDALHAARMRGEDEAPLLAAFDPQASPAEHGPESDSAATTNYFIGRCLLSRRDPRAVPYLIGALRDRPTWPKAWLATGVALLGSPFWKSQGQPLR